MMSSEAWAMIRHATQRSAILIGCQIALAFTVLALVMSEHDPAAWRFMGSLPILALAHAFWRPTVRAAKATSLRDAARDRQSTIDDGLRWFTEARIVIALVGVGMIVFSGVAVVAVRQDRGTLAAISVDIALWLAIAVAMLLHVFTVGRRESLSPSENP